MTDTNQQPAIKDYEEFGHLNGPIHGWRRSDRTNSHAILFVHGYWGSATDTWRLDAKRKSFQELIMNDNILNDHDIITFSYNTSLLTNLRIDRVAKQLENELKALEHSYKLILVAHSLGGLVCMRYVIDQLKQGSVPSISGLIFYGTPIKGVEMLRIAKLMFPPLSKIPGFGLLSGWVTGNVASLAPSVQLLQDLQHDWTGRVCNGGDVRFPLNGRTWFPIRIVTGNEDWVVTEDSARGVLGDKDWFPVDRSHIAMVKPSDAEDPCYRHARSFFKLCHDSQSPEIRSKLFETSDWVLKHLSEKVVRDWKYELDISDAESSIAGTSDWSCPIKIKRCRYTLLLAERPWSFGLGLGFEAIEKSLE